MIKQFKSDSFAVAKVSMVLAFIVLCFGRIQAQCPVNASFTSSTVYVCQGGTVNFTNTTTGGASFYNWLENAVSFSAVPSPSRTFSVPGQYLISLVASNGTCLDTANTIVVVDATVNGAALATDASCFGFTNGTINLTPSGGTPNIAYYNDRALTHWSSINTVSQSNFTNGISIAFWAKPNATWTLSDGMVVGFNTSTAANRFLFGYNAARQQFVYFDDIAGNRFQTGTAARGQWHHVVMTMTAAKTITIYVNGVSALTYTTTGNSIPAVGDLVSIGQEFDGIGVISQHFDGAIDELSIWNAALTGPTAIALFNQCGPISATHPNINNLVAYYSMNEGTGNFLFDRSGNNNHGSRQIGSVWTTPPQTNYGCFAPATGYSYVWNSGAITEDRSGLAAGNYTVTLTDGVGCRDTVASTVGQPAPVVVTVSALPNDSVCAGQSTVLSASGANSYSWSPSATLSASTGSVVTSTPVQTVTYTITGTDASSCQGVATQTITVLANPTAVISGDNDICLGDSTILTASGATGYSWSTGSTNDSILLAPSGSGAYSVTVTDAFGCQDNETLFLTVNPLPVVGISGDTIVCVGDSTTLVASGGNIFSWSTGSSNSSTTITPTASAYYSVIVTDSNTCSNRDSVFVLVNPLPVVAITGNNQVCLGTSTSITATGGTNYAWSNGDTTSIVLLGPASQTTYFVTVTDANTCSRTDSVVIDVLALPLVLASGGDTICFGDSLVLTATGASTYLWNFGATSSSAVVFPANNGFYTVAGTDSNGCTGSDTTYVIVNAPPAISISGPTSVCEGNSATFTASGGTSYSWSTGDNSNNIVVLPSAGSYTYTVTVTNTEGCTNTGNIGLTVNNSPTAVITGATSVCVGSSINLTASGGTAYSWSTGGNTATITVTPAIPSTYSVTVSDGQCTDTTSHFVAVNPLPATPTITQAGNVLNAPTGFATYQWFLNGNPIAGASSSSYTATVSGTYTVQVTDGNACSSLSANYEFSFVGVGELSDLEVYIGVYPNPSQGAFTLSLISEKRIELELVVTDLLGQMIWSTRMDVFPGENEKEIRLDNLSKGVYLLQVSSKQAQKVKKLIIE